MSGKKLFIAAAVVLLFNCSKSYSENQCLNKYNKTSLIFLDTNKKNHQSITDAIELVREIMNGEIISACRKFRKDYPYWEINIIAAGGSSVEVEIVHSEMKILSMSSDEGPFTYDLKPSDVLISFFQAVRVVSEKTTSPILKWKFLKVKDKWEYDFWLFTKSGKAQMRVDAETGEIISAKKKKK
ncbi:MAG: PepSY domain-containing protein [Bacteroidetes bacterium]|nr:PepSY domain-containing protein [Bacteroidota bacterium]